ncbi:MAG: hypothetical protein ACXABO_06380 [Promethearchaeota archaeon]
MVTFLLLYEKKVEYDKGTIDSGHTPQKLYEICSSIRETFCLSYSIRKNNNMFLYFQKEHILVIFIGKELRYLGPDERSQALLLEKAFRKAGEIKIEGDNRKNKSTPGIYVSKFTNDISFISYIESIIRGEIYFIDRSNEFASTKKEIKLKNSSFIPFGDDSFFIIPINSNSKQAFNNFKKFREIKNVKFLSLSKIKSIEDIILYINYLKDLHGNL